MKKADRMNTEVCEKFHRAIELIGRRWNGAIISVLLRSRCRFADLRAAIPDITDRMLSDRLQELEQEGVLERTVLPETPVRIEYSLTKKGRALASAFQAIGEWAHKWDDEKSTSTPKKRAVRHVL
ncbi:MAG TPA: helix-turn-helix domain-containing protein [Thermoanaerobaculia bacterium]